MGSKRKSRALVRTEEGEYVPFEVPEERRGKRPTHFTTSITFRIPEDAKEILIDIANYEYLGGRISELVRKWVAEKIQTYKRNPRFKEYLKLKARLIAEGKEKAMKERQARFAEVGRSRSAR